MGGVQRGKLCQFENRNGSIIPSAFCKKIDITKGKKNSAKLLLFTLAITCIKSSSYLRTVQSATLSEPVVGVT